MQGWQTVRLLRANVRRSKGGFTLAEVLVVTIISGILAAIALPAFLNRVNTAKQAEAKVYVGTLNRAQQAYATEHLRFASNFGDLGVAIRDTGNYQYTIAVDGTGNSYAIQHAESKAQKLRPYVGITALIQSQVQGPTTQTLLCEGDQPTAGKATDPLYTNVAIECAPGTHLPK